MFFLKIKVIFPKEKDSSIVLVLSANCRVYSIIVPAYASRRSRIRHTIYKIGCKVTAFFWYNCDTAYKNVWHCVQNAGFSHKNGGFRHFAVFQ